jgi:hypothetical protein
LRPDPISDPRLFVINAEEMPLSGQALLQLMRGVLAGGYHSTLIQGDNGCEHLDGIIPRENLPGRVTREERNGLRTWSGLGPERRIIAWLSAAGLLTHLRTSLPVFWKPFCRRRR